MPQKTDTMQAMGEELLQEVLRHKIIPFKKSKLSKFWPRSSITAGLAEKTSNIFYDQKGMTLSFLLTEANLPSSVFDNPYVDFTKKGGKKSLEAKLAARLAKTKGDLSPARMLGESLDVCKEDYWAATLTLHNLLKEITYSERKFGQAIIGWDKSDNQSSKGWVFLTDLASVSDKLRNLRPKGDKFPDDKMAILYHTFGLLFISGMTSGSEAQAFA